MSYKTMRKKRCVMDYEMITDTCICTNDTATDIHMLISLHQPVSIPQPVIEITHLNDEDISCLQEY